GAGIDVEVARLRALVVRETHEPALVESLELYVARRGPAGGVGGGEHHRVRLVERSTRAVPPSPELLDRICVEVAALHPGSCLAPECARHTVSVPRAPGSAHGRVPAPIRR